jgi:hypothetical protein
VSLGGSAVVHPRLARRNDLAALPRVRTTAKPRCEEEPTVKNPRGEPSCEPPSRTAVENRRGEPSWRTVV